MLKLIFNYKGLETVIQCNIYEEMEEVLKKYKSKMEIEIEIDNVYYLYNGDKINKENKLEEIINNEDRRINKMVILVDDLNEKEDNNNIIETKGIICPECSENVIININEYKLIMKCNNNHNNIILLKEYNNIINNIIDISKMKCKKCKKNRNYIYNNELYICLNCKMNLCPLCKSSHDKNHYIIKYDNKNYICNKHNEIYTKYLYNKNICMLCENEHKNHKSLYYGELLTDINDEIKEYIDKFKNEMKNIFDNIINNIDIYYNIYKNIIDYYKKRKKNYEILQNINEFNRYNKIIIKDIKEIINVKDNNIKFKNIMNIYNKMNNNKIYENKEEKRYDNYIIGEFEIKENNKEIRIINSYEEFCREYNWPFKDENKNEKEIKENIEIIINDKNIPFTYLYKFKEKGKYKIKYIFKKSLTNTCCMFYGCSSLNNLNLSNFNTQNVINMACMFYECSSLNNLNLSNFNTQNVINMSSMFFECSSLNNLNLSYFNTQNVTDMSFMFFGCSSLNNLNLSNFNTQNVTNMDSMFSGCSSLNNINLSTFNTQKVTNMGGIFNGCSSLNNANLSTFNTQKVTDMGSMFCECSSLNSLNLSNFNTQKVSNTGCMFDGCSSLRKENIITNDHNIFKLLKYY